VDVERTTDLRSPSGGPEGQPNPHVVLREKVRSGHKRSHLRVVSGVARAAANPSGRVAAGLRANQTVARSSDRKVTGDGRLPSGSSPRPRKPHLIEVGESGEAISFGRRWSQATVQTPLGGRRSQRSFVLREKRTKRSHLLRKVVTASGAAPPGVDDASGCRPQGSARWEVPSGTSIVGVEIV